MSRIKDLEERVESLENNFGNERYICIDGFYAHSNTVIRKILEYLGLTIINRDIVLTKIKKEKK